RNARHCREAQGYEQRVRTVDVVERRVFEEASRDRRRKKNDLALVTPYREEVRCPHRIGDRPYEENEPCPGRERYEHADDRPRTSGSGDRGRKRWNAEAARQPESQSRREALEQQKRRRPRGDSQGNQEQEADRLHQKSGREPPCGLLAAGQAGGERTTDGEHGAPGDPEAGPARADATRSAS